MKSHLPGCKEASVVPARFMWWPLALLLLALSSTFLFSHERGQFYRTGHHDYLSSHHLAIAVNLSPAHDFLLFERRLPVSEDEVRYIPYNRFPMGGYLLIKLATLPFDDLSSQIYAARVLMLLFSAATALLVFDAVRRLAGNSWIALAATLFAFAAPYCLYYNDLIATETLAFFGVALVFHGLTTFVTAGRFGQLVAKTCVALLLGWYVFALLLPFTALGLLREALDERGGWRERLRGLARSRYLRLGVIAVLFGLGMVAFNLENERRALGGDRPLSTLPTFSAMLERFGALEEFNAEHGEALGLPAAIGRSLYRIGRMAGPYALPGYSHNLGDFPVVRAAEESPAAQVVGLVVVAGTLVGLLFVRRKVLLASAALYGLAWGLLMRNMSAFHDFESLLFVGLCALFFALALCWVRRVAGERAMPAVALFAVACFVQSSWSMSQVGADEKASEREAQKLEDFDLIRKVVRGAAVSVDRELTPWTHASDYYLQGSKVIRWPGERHDLADFTVMRTRMDVRGALTPGNAVAFLYDTEQLTAFVEGLVEGGQQMVSHAHFDVYFHEGARVLIFVAGDAAPIEDMDVFVHLAPAVEALLPAQRRQYGFDDLSFEFNAQVQLSGRRRAQVVFLPRYPIRWVSTGRRDRSGELWRKGFGLDLG